MGAIMADLPEGFVLNEAQSSPPQTNSGLPAGFTIDRPQNDPGAWGAAGRGAAQGLTANFSDEMRAIAEAGGVKPESPAGLADYARGAYRYWSGDPEAEKAYNAAVERERAANVAAQKAHPWAYGAGEIGGALPTMALIPGGGAAAETAGLGTRMVQSGIAGGIYGGAAGVGAGADGQDRLQQGLTGTAGGILGGAAAPLAGELVRGAVDRFGRPLASAVRGMFNPEAEASRRIAGAIAADSEDIAAGNAKGMSWDDWARARAAGEPVTLSDLGSARTQSLLRSAANTSPEARGLLEKTIEDRFAGQSERVAQDIRGLLPGGANAGKTAEQLVADYDIKRAPAYRKAFSSPYAQQLWDGEFDRMSQAPVVQSAIRMATVNARDEAAKLNIRPPPNPFIFNRDGSLALANENVVPNLQFWDVVKKNLDATGSREAQQWSKILRSRLDAYVPEYADARGIAANFFGERNALEAGQKLAGKRIDPQAVQRIMGKMDPDERNLFREGYASDWANRVISEFRDTRDITKAMFNSPNERKRAEIIFGKSGVAKIEQRMKLEGFMDASRRAMGNSTTARQLIEAGLAGGALAGYQSGWDPTRIAEGATAAAGARKFLAKEMAAGAQKLVGRVDTRTAAYVAEKLMSNDPRQLVSGLTGAARSKKISDALTSATNRIARATAVTQQPRPRVLVTTPRGGQMPPPSPFAPAPANPYAP